MWFRNALSSLAEVSLYTNPLIKQLNITIGSEHNLADNVPDVTWKDSDATT